MRIAILSGFGTDLEFGSRGAAALQQSLERPRKRVEKANEEAEDLLQAASKGAGGGGWGGGG